MGIYSETSGITRLGNSAVPENPRKDMVRFMGRASMMVRACFPSRQKRNGITIKKTLAMIPKIQSTYCIPCASSEFGQGLSTKRV